MKYYPRCYITFGSELLLYMKEFHLVYFFRLLGGSDCKMPLGSRGRDWQQNFRFLSSERGVQVIMEPLVYLLVTTVDLRRCFAYLDSPNLDAIACSLLGVLPGNFLIMFGGFERCEVN